jgi:hypothetical protein
MAEKLRELSHLAEYEENMQLLKMRKQLSVRRYIENSSEQPSLFKERF